MITLLLIVILTTRESSVVIFGRELANPTNFESVILATHASQSQQNEFRRLQGSNMSRGTHQF